MSKIFVWSAFTLSLWAGSTGAHEKPADQISHFTQILQTDPQDREAYLQRGELNRLASRWPADALALLGGITPATSPALFIEGRALHQLGRHSAAAAVLAEKLHAYLSAPTLTLSGETP